MNDKQVAELFVEQRVLEPSQAEDVLTEVELNGKSVAQAIIDGGYVDERGFYQTMAEALGTDYIDLTEGEIAQEVLRFVPAGMARLHGALPIDMIGNVLRVALVDPLDRASDIHFEPFENEFKIRYRVDGALYEMAPPPRHLALPVISRVKVMANMNIAERRLPQDGRIQKNIAGRNIDLRVSTLPTQFGESVVLRVLDRSTVNLDLEMIGMPEEIHTFILEMIQRPNGIFIVNGPTGSGK